MTTPPARTAVDIAILGAGPAGCSAASWLNHLGIKAALIDRAPAICQSLRTLSFEQDWVLGDPGVTLTALAERYAAHTRSLPSLDLHLGRTLDHLDWQAGSGWTLTLDKNETLHARGLLLATGLRPLRPEVFFPTGRPPHARVLDAISLTQQKQALKPGRILLLGGGDNAVENALTLHQLGHQVTIWSRSDWRAQTAFLARLQDDAAITQRQRTAMPTALTPDADGVTLTSKAHGIERFDHVAVLLGFEPEPSAWQLVADALQRAGVTAPAQPYRDEPRFNALGLMVAGDTSGRQHPCVQTALADGVVAAKQAEAFLRPRPEGEAPVPLQRNNRQVLTLAGLRFGAKLGVLDFEREGPQPIQVDAEINLGAQTIVSRDADIGHVLDYRKVRQILIDECTSEHTDLLEALLGKLCTRVMKLPGVVGVRIKVTKLEIFPDCEVAISAEVGAW